MLNVSGTGDFYFCLDGRAVMSEGKTSNGNAGSRDMERARMR